VKSPENYCIEPIGVVRSCYSEKFGIPRQPGLVDAARAVIELDHAYGSKESVAGLEGYSHIWVLFWFHQTAAQGWKPQVRPPRLGGNEKMGLFATRSMFRPNPIGQSLVRLDSVEIDETNGQVKLHIGGADLLDLTPVIDIKPYIPYVESIPDASAGLFQHPPVAAIAVTFATDAQEQLQKFIENCPERYADLGRLIEQVLGQDPRPAYHKEEGREYGVALYDLNICWVVKDGDFEVLSIERIEGDATHTDA